MKLGTVINGWRRIDGRGLRDVAKEIGITYTTLFRLEGGGECDGDTLAHVLCWLMDRQPKKK